jgi:hypothetical protein
MAKAPNEIINESESFKGKSKDELQNALASKTSVENFYFPQNIQEIDHWMAIRVIKRDISSLRASGDYEVKKDLARIFLPLPLNLATSYAQSYNADSIGPLGAAAAGAGGTARSIIEDAAKGNFSKALKKGIDSAVNAAGGITVNGALKEGSALAAYVGATAAEGIGDAFGGVIPAAGVGKGIMGGAGLAKNPYMAVLYKEPEFRTHEFTWKTVAKNFEESQSILNIIKLLKYYSAPSIPAGGVFKHFFDYPEQFDIDFHHDEFLYNIGPSVLKNVSVNYHSEGQPLYFTKEVVIDEIGEEEGQASKTVKVPVSITISLSFQEISIITKKEIMEQNR